MIKISTFIASIRQSFPQKRMLGAALFVALVLIFLPTQHSHAGWFSTSIDNILGNAVAFGVFVINYIVASLFGIAIAFQAWFIQVVLQMNDNVINSAVVQTGFGVSLAIANLGFVFAIVVVAIATIVRYESYGLRQTLWRLIVAAILVNFSLVIAGSIINLSNGFSKYFLTGLTGQGGGCPPTINPANCSFAMNMAAVYQPQQYFAPDSSDNTNKLSGASYFSGLSAGAGATVGNAIAPILSLFFAGFGLFLIVIVLGALGVLLLIRYVALSLLLVVMPFAWLFWIFPITRSNWQKWWSTFIRWVIFAPIVLFFLYLVIATGAAIRNNSAGSPYNGPQPGFSSGAVGIVGSSLSNFFGNLLTPILGAFLNSLVLMGLTVGGLVFANSMSLTGANVVMGAAKSAANWGAVWGGRKAMRGASYPFRGERAAALRQSLREGTIGQNLGRSGGRLNRLVGGAARMATAPLRKQEPTQPWEEKPGVISRGVNKLGTTAGAYAARGLEAIAIAGGSGMVETAKAEMKKANLSDDYGSNNFSTMTPPQQIAFLGQLLNNGNLDKLKQLTPYLDQNPQLAQLYQQEKLLGSKDGPGDINKAIGSTPEMRKYAAAMEKDGEENAVAMDAEGKILVNAEGKQVKAAEALEKAAEDLAKKYSKGDKVQWNDINSGKAVFGLSDKSAQYIANALNKGISNVNPQLISSVVGKLKGAERIDNFGKSIRESLFVQGVKIAKAEGQNTAEIEKNVQEMKDVKNFEEREAITDKLMQSFKDLKKTMGSIKFDTVVNRLDKLNKSIFSNTIGFGDYDAGGKKADTE